MTASVISWITAGQPAALAWLRTGAPAQTMITGAGVRTWVGAGPPIVVVGAGVGDLYLDSTTGMLYRLD